MGIFTALFGQRSGAPVPEGRRIPNRGEIEAYVAAELRKALPDGWRVDRRDAKQLWWNLERVSVPPGEWGMQDFGLLVSEDFQWFILTHGNSDCGFWGLHHALMNAMVIPASSLQLPNGSADELGGVPRFQLSQCIRFVIENRQPNEWGYT